MILSTPYLHVQAIRRRYRDRGKPTIAKPTVYVIRGNLPGAGGVNTEVTASVAIDSDSDFVWLSSYFYKQFEPYDPTATNDGEVTDRPNNIELRIVLVNSGRVLSNPSFMPGLPFDWGAGQAGLAGTIPENESIDGGPGTNDDFGPLRCYLPEPIICEAGERVQCTFRVREFDQVNDGHALLLQGVSLYTVGG